MTENKMVAWHHCVNEHDFEQALGDDEVQGRLVYCSLWGHKKLGMTEQLNRTELIAQLVKNLPAMQETPV